MKQRIDYIDRMKGIAILLVVMALVSVATIPTMTKCSTSFLHG